MMKIEEIEKLCLEKGLKVTSQRKIIIKVIFSSNEHPDVEEIYHKANKLDAKIGIATVYRTVRMLEEAGLIQKHDFGDGRARYESISEEHHDHLIDIRSGHIIEFHNEEIEQLQKKIAEKLGYKLVDHRLELYAVPLSEKK